MNVPTAEIARATGARASDAGGLPKRVEIATDTRAIRPGALFVALRGARFDGHEHVAAALAAGASGVVVSRPEAVPPGTPAFVVADTAQAYLALGALARSQSRVALAAVTGSAGKTTTRALLAMLLETEAPGRVAAALGNENNELGVAKLLLAVPEGARYVVAELGARHFGEIEPLARAARPDVAILTNVGEAHLEIMGSPQRLADTKWALFATGAAPVLGAADAVSRERAGTLGRPVTWFALDAETAPATSADAVVRLLDRERLAIERAGATETFDVTVGVPGDHNRRNVAAAAAGALALGLAPGRIAAALAELVLPAGRYERVELGAAAAIYDAYNASPAGTLATLASFAAEPAARRIAVIASMAEVGPESADHHVRVGAAAARAGLTTLLVGGDFAGDLARGARDGGLAPENVVPFADNAAALAWLRANVRPGDLVLFKGSRRYRLEEIVAGLREAGATGG